MYIVDLKEDENGEVVLQLPDELIAELGWQEGDIILWKMEGNAAVLSKKESKGV